MSNKKVLIVNLIVTLIEKILLHKMSYFPPYVHNKNKLKIDLDLSNYATKSEKVLVQQILLT